ncbi:MAG: iron hydrogenase small subunit [Bacilli bacterium]|nr:iron hydrogenase small subunit [Bacilli bacterium]
MSKVNVTINGKVVEVENTATVLEAATLAGVNIPRLCFLKGINENSACRLCVVEINDRGRVMMKNSCTVQVSDGMIVNTNTPRVKMSVTKNLQLLAASHRFECWKCPREHNCEFLALLRRYNIPNVMGEDDTFSKKPQIVNITDALEIDSSKCVLCGRCIAACQKLAGTGILDYNNRGFKTYVGPALNHNMDTTGCIFCGKCIQACPVGAIKEKDDIDQAIDMINNPEIYTVAQIAPSVRAALGEEFGYKMGTNVEGKIYAALQKLGFDDVTDTNFAADVTIMEEGTELLGRIEKHLKGEDAVLPMFTSCSPGWIRYIETYYPEFLPNLSTTKSPQQIQGALIKHYYANKLGVDPAKVRVISFMPCIAKKYEAKRPEMETNGLRDVDLVLTTRELARFIKREGIDFNSLEDAKLTSPLAQYTGAGVIFGATGGVMEAALRTVRDILEAKDYKDVDITPVRGTENVKEATLTIAGKELTVAVVHGAVNFPEIFEKIKANPGKYAFIEFMGCTGGCVNGGGQPVVSASVQEQVDVRAERAKALYTIDNDAKFRKSHDNPAVKALYEEFLKEPNGHLAHELLHTTYSPKGKYEE